MEADQKTKSIREMLLEQNQPARIDGDHYNFYYALLPLGNNQTQPGADLNAQVGAIISKMEADQKTRSVREMLLEQNRPERIDADHYNFYYALLPLGNNQSQPGADLNGNWYLRNAKIFPSWHRLRSLAIALSSHSVRDIATGCGILSATRRALFWSRRTIICDSSGTLGRNSRSPSSARRAEIDLWETRLFIVERLCGRRCNAHFTVT
jgi:hypothetical protein